MLQRWVDEVYVTCVMMYTKYWIHICSYCKRVTMYIILVLGSAF